MDVETLRVVAVSATTLAGGISVSLATAVIGAMVEAVLPGWGTRVRVGTRSALSVALRAFSLVMMGAVVFVMLAGTLAVALLRLAARPRVTGHNGRHGARGRGRRWQRAGEHRRPVSA